MCLRRKAVGLTMTLVFLGAGRLPAQTSRAERASVPPERHWAFQPVRRPPVPEVRGRAWVRTPVDAFVLARLEAVGLRPSPPADRRTLLRRVTLDLTGLPPTPDEQRAFLDDPSPDAFAKVVDGLLARPQYGERWGRHWLDVARYAETNGYERDGAKPNAWRYRDYVIDSLNADKPYDRFVTEQVAGDEVDDTNAEAQVAATFLRLGSWDDEPADPKVDRYDQLDDVLGTTATAFLGLTLRCARCHDHKFEPFSQADYYGLLAVFEPLKRPQKGRADHDVPVGNLAELAASREASAKVDVAADAVRERVKAQDDAVRARLLASGKTSLPPDAVAAFRAEPDKRDGGQKQLVKKFATQLERDVRSGAAPEEKERRGRWEQEIAALETRRPRGLPRAYVWSEDGTKAPPTRVFRRGDPTKPREEVEPTLPAVLVKAPPPAPRPTSRTTGRRLWLARWLTAPDNPLTARVMVNRVWQGHFGRGLVATANDFGVAGEAPSHPELLDWLAARFVADGGRLKPLHRAIVLSNAYQTSATTSPEAVRADPRDVLLSHWRQRRLEAEAVRDSILAVSGRLNPEPRGPSVYPALARAVLEGQSRPGDGWGKSDERQASRRSVYVFVKRSLAVPELDLLDAPDTTTSCEARPVSTTAPQALTFLNGAFVNEQAKHFAARLARDAGADPKARVRRAFELALGRPPRDEEVRLALAFLKEQSPEAFCLVLLNTNEFVYLD